MRFWLLVGIALGSVAAIGCGDDECKGAACVAAMTDAGPPPAMDAGPLPDGFVPPDAGPDTGCNAPNACALAGTCPAADTVDLDLTRVESASLPTAGDANPEQVDLIPGTNRAVVVSSSINELTLLEYTPTTVTQVREVPIDAGGLDRGISDIAVHPSGEFAAVTVIQQTADALGELIMVDLSEAGFGTVLSRVTVGYTPDSVVWTRDGMFAITADEDDRQDHPMKPETRFGGSISVVKVDGDPAGACLVSRTLVDHARDSEPEGVAVGADGAIAFTIQETSQMGFLDLRDLPEGAPCATIDTAPALSDPGIVAAGDLCEPDGISVSPDGRWFVIGCERTDEVVVYSYATRAEADRHHIEARTEVPDEYNRDERDPPYKVFEPQANTFISAQGAYFVLLTLQESHAVIAYRVDATTGQLTYDSIAPVGRTFTMEMFGRAGSNISPEGVVADVERGLVITAQEEEGSITVTSIARTQPEMCF